MTHQDVPVEQIAVLLDAAVASSERRQELGQEAATLWWQLDERGLCGADPVPTWERALLGLAAWHTGGDELRRQRADSDELATLYRALATGPDG